MRRFGKEPFPVIYQDPKPDSDAAKSGQLYEVVAKSQLKKMTKLWQQEVKKAAAKGKKSEAKKKSTSPNENKGSRANASAKVLFLCAF